jgi:hypothetical protein
VLVLSEAVLVIRARNPSMDDDDYAHEHEALALREVVELSLDSIGRGGL